MTVPLPRLDDLTWDALMTATRQRIPAESGGAWTLHAPADPGVTVLELLAYLLEQRLYRLDQVPDALVVAVLRLLGVPGPAPAVPAATVLRLTGSAPAGTVFTRDPLEQLTFTLDEDVTVAPVRDVTVWAGGRDRGADLRAGRGVPLLPAGGDAASFRVDVAFDGAAPPPGTVVSLLFDLDTPAGVPPQWSPDAVRGVRPPADLSWSWSLVDDGTAGLRRSGIVRLELPAEGPLTVATRASTYAAPPVLRQLVPNTGIARQRETRTVTDADLRDQLTRWLRLPGQHLDLPGARGVLLDAELRLRRRGAVQVWSAAPDLTFAGPGDPVFVLDRAEGALRFGDGLTGAVPVHDDLDGPGAVGIRSEERSDEAGWRRLPGAFSERSERDKMSPGPVVEVEYRRGGGAAGNGGRTDNWWVAGRPAGGAGAANVVPAAGGRDAETVDEARRRAAEELTRVTRAVTAADFAELAAGTPGVAVGRSYVGIGEHPGYPGTTVPGAVVVRVVPAVTGVPAPRPDPGMLAAVRRHLERARLIGTELYVCRPRYRTAALRVDLADKPSDPGRVRSALEEALRGYLDPLTGGDDGDGWPFGGPLHPSALLRVAQAAAGDTARVAAVAVGLDGAPPAVDCADVPLRRGELPALSGVTIGVGT
ncbi:putative baseplate assembly protein [Phytohabitans houttuyneae]|uniref:Putative baseplate assembly protein n=1 Tax=Phytohabitans houttuyneae TaxID=1076126 RepID=A0A6V8KPZ7_9ACTN|nr:putative baseplate assembly protein [Phytohabitans houttuyneae]GFJ84451.1 putative baseplate assembly protein [Phytohabitans houttuyneae]